MSTLNKNEPVLVLVIHFWPASLTPTLHVQISRVFSLDGDCYSWMNGQNYRSWSPTRSRNKALGCRHTEVFNWAWRIRWPVGLSITDKTPNMTSTLRISVCKANAGGESVCVCGWSGRNEGDSEGLVDRCWFTSGISLQNMLFLLCVFVLFTVQIFKKNLKSRCIY